MTTTATRGMYDDGTRRTLAELRAANLPRCTPQTLGVDFTIQPEHIGNPEAEKALDDARERLGAYLRAFVHHDGCVKCGATLGGSDRDPLSAMFGTFEWGLAHGEGRCGRCGYPARGLHHVDLGDCGEISLPRILQYHPDELRGRGEEPTP